MISAVANSQLVAKIITNIAVPIIEFLTALAIIYFLYGVVVYLKGAASSDERQIGAKHMMWGIIGLVVMVSVLGIMDFVEGSITGLGGRLLDPNNLQIIK